MFRYSDIALCVVYSNCRFFLKKLIFSLIFLLLNKNEFTEVSSKQSTAAFSTFTNKFELKAIYNSNK